MIVHGHCKTPRPSIQQEARRAHKMIVHGHCKTPRPSIQQEARRVHRNDRARPSLNKNAGPIMAKTYKWTQGFISPFLFIAKSRVSVSRRMAEVLPPCNGRVSLIKANVRGFYIQTTGRFFLFVRVAGLLSFIDRQSFYLPPNRRVTMLLSCESFLITEVGLHCPPS